MSWNSRFALRDQIRFFDRHAERVQWAQAVRCGCSNTPENPSNSACVVCGGLGYFYPQGLHTTRMILTSIRQQEDLVMMGLAQMGDLIGDQPPGAVSLSSWDLVLTTWTDGMPFIGTTLVRGNGSTDNLPYRAQAVYAVVQTDPTTGAVTTYAPTDYTVHGKTLTWLANAPATGSSYTIRYNASYEWVVFAPGLVRIERGTNFGPRTLLRKREIILPNLPDLLSS